MQRRDRLRSCLQRSRPMHGTPAHKADDYIAGANCETVPQGLQLLAILETESHVRIAVWHHVHPWQMVKPHIQSKPLREIPSSTGDQRFGVQHQ